MNNVSALFDPNLIGTSDQTGPVRPVPLQRAQDDSRCGGSYHQDGEALLAGLEVGSVAEAGDVRQSGPGGGALVEAQTCRGELS